MVNKPEAEVLTACLCCSTEMNAEFQRLEADFYYYEEEIFACCFTFAVFGALYYSFMDKPKPTANKRLFGAGLGAARPTSLRQMAKDKAI